MSGQHLNEDEHRWMAVDFGPQPAAYCSGCGRFRPDPWDACAAVDPFTGQPDQHEHGDSCSDEACSE